MNYHWLQRVLVVSFSVCPQQANNGAESETEKESEAEVSAFEELLIYVHGWYKYLAGGGGMKDFLYSISG